MKRIFAVLLAFVIVASLAACSGAPSYTPQQVDEMVETGEMGTIQAFYSIKNSPDGKGDFYVQFNSALESVFDFYSEDGTLVEFDGKVIVYDSEGNEVPRSEIEYGQALIIVFNGEAEDVDPPTIKAYKVTLA